MEVPLDVVPTLPTLPLDLLSELLEALGPCSFRALAVCTALRRAVLDKLLRWRQDGRQLCTADLTDLRIHGQYLPLSCLHHQYDNLGVRLTGTAMGVFEGVGAGDPGNWQLEGTTRGVPGGGRFIGFNTHGQCLRLSFRHAVTSCAFDLVTRDAGCEVALVATAADGTELHVETLSFGPSASSWVSPAAVQHDVAAHAARAIATTHCTAVRLARGAAQLAQPGAVDAVATIALRADDELAALTLTFHDQASAKDDERAIGLANLRVGL